MDLKESLWGFILDEVMFGAEYAVRDYFFSSQRASTIAFAAIYIALSRVDIRARREIALALHLVVDALGLYSELDSKNLFAVKNRLTYTVENEAPEQELSEVYRALNLDAAHIDSRAEHGTANSTPPKNSLCLGTQGCNRPKYQQKKYSQREYNARAA